MRKLMHIVLHSFLISFVLAGISLAQTEEAPAALSQDVLHRIMVEIRAHYSVPSQIEVSVSAPKASNIPGYDEIVITFKGGTHTSAHDFLISKDRKTLSHMEKIDVSQDVMAKIDVKGRPVRGNSTAKVTIINFDDFQCPFCSIVHATLFPEILKTYGDKIKFIYKDYPIVEIHPWAMHAAVDANCLATQNGEAYWDFADYVHANQKVISGHNLTEASANLDRIAADQAEKHHLDVPALKVCTAKNDVAAVKASIAEGDKLGVDSTPTLFINGEKVLGVKSPEELQTIITRALAEAGVTTPSEARK